MSKIKAFFELGEVGRYFFRKKDPKNRPNFNLRAMHTINKISILIFIVALIVLVLRRFS